jgi:hypothetical protein
LPGASAGKEDKLSDALKYLQETRIIVRHDDGLEFVK